MDFKFSDLLFRHLNFIDFYFGIFLIDLNAFSAVVANLFRVEVADVAFSAIVADFVFVKYANIAFHFYHSKMLFTAMAIAAFAVSYVKPP